MSDKRHHGPAGAARASSHSPGCHCANLSPYAQSESLPMPAYRCFISLLATCFLSVQLLLVPAARSEERRVGKSVALGAGRSVYERIARLVYAYCCLLG